MTLTDVNCNASLQFVNYIEILMYKVYQNSLKVIWTAMQKISSLYIIKIYKIAAQIWSVRQFYLLLYINTNMYKVFYQKDFITSQRNFFKCYSVIKTVVPYKFC